MDVVEPSYWRDAELAGLQFTANRFMQRDVRAHRHAGHALSVADCDLQVRTSRGLIDVPAGALLRIGPRVWHAVQARSRQWRESALYCSAAVARSVNDEQHAQPLAPIGGDEEVAVFEGDRWGYEFSECHNLLWHAQYSKDIRAGDAGRMLLRRRLVQWLPLRSVRAPETASVPPSEDVRVNRLYDLIASGFQGRLTLQDMADAVGWHPVYMQRRFRGALRFTPHELVVGHRIEYARDLIAGGALVTYAAHAAGFSDQSHLHKTFLSTYAVVPGEYRRLSGLDALQPPSARNGIVD